MNTFQHLRPSPQVFLQYYCTRLGELVSWLSLVGQSHQCLLASYTQSFKRFKTGFFKVVIRSAGAGYFYFENGEPKFPFYWPRTSLAQEDLCVLSYLDQLPKKLSSKKIIGVFSSSHSLNDLFSMYVRLTPHRYASGMFGLTLISFCRYHGYCWSLW